MSAAASTFTYDGIGRVLMSTDFKGGLTNLAYTPSQLSVTVTDPAQQPGGSPCTTRCRFG